MQKLLKPLATIICVLISCLSFGQIPTPSSLVYENQLTKVVITLEDTPCSKDKVLNLIPQEFVKHFQNGFVIFQKTGERINFCWALGGDGIIPASLGEILIIDENANAGFILMEKFAKKEHI